MFLLLPAVPPSSAVTSSRLGEVTSAVFQRWIAGVRGTQDIKARYFRAGRKIQNNKVGTAHVILKIYLFVFVCIVKQYLCNNFDGKRWKFYLVLNEFS